MKKLSLIFFCFCLWSSVIAQEDVLLKILNTELKKEIKNQLRSPYFDGDTITVLQPFTIDSKKNISILVKKNMPYQEGTWIVKQEVPLHAVKKIGKDINIILETGDNHVITTSYKQEDGSETAEKVMGNLFFLFLSNEKENEELGIALQKAFLGAGISVMKEYWYD